MACRVSIIIPCYNLTQRACDAEGRTAFDICMDSVLRQTIGLANMEIILVNDASTDDGRTADILQAYEQQYPEHITVIHLEENQRQGGARNIGLKYAGGTYVAFLDADDWVDESLYERAVALADKEQSDMVYFFHQAVKGKLKQPMDDISLPLHTWIVETTEQRKQFLMTQVIDYRCTTKLYRRELLAATAVRFPVHKIYEEPMFTYPLMFYGRKYTVLPELLYNYRINPDSTMNTSHTFERLKNHPEVQLMLLSELADRNLLDTYYNEISYHFLHSYFMETMLFAGNQNICIPAVYFGAMQQTVLQLFPAWENNPYIEKSEEDILYVVLSEGLKLPLNQEAIQGFCQKVKMLCSGKI